MTRLVRVWVVVVLVATLGWYGGAGDLARPLLAIAIAIALIGTAIGLRTELRPPPMAWISLLFLPLIAVGLLQVLPFGWHHPWVAGDLEALNADSASWSIDPAASIEAVVWYLTLAALALVVCVLARGERVRGLVDALLYVAVISAVLGFCLSLTATPWPSADRLSTVRGPFIYPNHAAAFWAACLPLATLVAHRRGGALRWSVVGLLALAVLLSASRGGILVAGVVMLPIAIHLLPPRARWRWAIVGVAVVAGWLWLIGLGEVADKFESLRGEQGVTLNGRVTIWQAALPVISDAGALGSGGGTTTAAFRRSGDNHFADALVNHLHSDPLEWCLEYGWLGALVAAAGLLAALARLRPQPSAWSDPGRRVLVLGAGAGLAVLILHACGDFIWHSPAVAIEGILLLCILALAGQAQEAPPDGRGRLVGWCLGVAALLVIAVWPSWRWHTSENLARDVERLVVARRAAGLPIDGAPVIDRAVSATAHSVRHAVVQAWLAQAAGTPLAAEDALRRAAGLAPGDASAWAQRALLAAESGDNQTASRALHRAWAWAPAWPDLHWIALRLVRADGTGLLPRDQLVTIMHTMLNSDRALEAWFFPLAAQVLGTAELAGRVRSAGLQLASSAEDWLARSGPLDDWLVVRARILAKQPRRPAALGLANDHLLGPGGWQPHLPIELEERRALGEALTTAGLPVPPALAEALIRDGAPWARWARPLDLLEETTRTELTALLRSELHRPWARGWADRVALTKRAMAGDGAVVTRDSDPLVIACLAGVSRTILAPTAVDATLRERAHLLLQRWREWEWQDLPHAGRWSWWFGDGAGSALIDTNRWTGLVVDGEWVGWVRGRQDLAPLLGHGLKRVVLLEP